MRVRTRINVKIGECENVDFYKNKLAKSNESLRDLRSKVRQLKSELKQVKTEYNCTKNLNSNEEKNNMDNNKNENVIDKKWKCTIF